MLLFQCFSATHLTDFLYGFSAMTAPKMFCKVPSTTSATLVRHYTITLYDKRIFAFSRMQIDVVVHHRICFDFIINTRNSMYQYSDTIGLPYEKLKRKKKIVVLYGYFQSGWPLNFISEIPFLSNSCTALGSGTYNSFVEYFGPSVTNQ